jgi:ferric-dicitrate binding protein FerR (iron transport regulator)
MPLALAVVGDETETVSQAISRVEQAAKAAQDASVEVRRALADAARKPPLRRRILVPLSLGVIGVVLLWSIRQLQPRLRTPVLPS